jgi:hypothetical protein
MPYNLEPRAIGTLTDAECRDIVSQIQVILWFDFARDEWDGEKEWSMDTLEYVSGVLSDHGLRPAEKEAK